MEGRRIYPILIICVIIVFAACIVVTVLADNDAPVITISENGILQNYTDEIPGEELLNGVTAYDDRDGDVTDSLRIRSIIVINEGEYVKVTYSAKDSKNNIAQESINIPYEGIAVAGDIANLEDIQDGTTRSQDSSETGETASKTESESLTVNSETETTSGEASEGSGEPKKIDQAAVNASGVPAIELKYVEYTVKRGTSFGTIEALDMVNTTYDDKEGVSNRIVINGLNTLDTNVAGDYELLYSVSDTEGNKSEVQTLMVHVIE